MKKKAIICCKKQRVSQKRKDWYAQLLAIAKQRGYALGWVSAAFHRKFGIWPPKSILSTPPSAAVMPEVMGFVGLLSHEYRKSVDVEYRQRSLLKAMGHDPTLLDKAKERRLQEQASLPTEGKASKPARNET
ncbi:hypothetical protein [Geobacter sp. 60473]|uniref:hypothetical protein n=1 Tax=Geobacter sp. 60473 TaxID=3080755 RepID=UPI0030C6DE4B